MMYLMSLDSFRPLSGSYISQLFGKVEHMRNDEIVSVPYRGATFLNIISATFFISF